MPMRSRDTLTNLSHDATPWQVMAITGMEADQVWKDPHGEVSARRLLQLHARWLLQLHVLHSSSPTPVGLQLRNRTVQGDVSVPITWACESLRCPPSPPTSLDPRA